MKDLKGSFRRITSNILQDLSVVLKRTKVVFFLLLPLFVYTQNISPQEKLTFNGDFRFRIEQDWNSRKANGNYRVDRTRLRYRMRFGVNYSYNSQINFGLRIRTGYNKKQQDAQLTLGDGLKEFGTLPIGFEKIFFKTEFKNFILWLGKNTFPFKKQNELFWSDNVYPEGIFVSKTFKFQTKIIQSLTLNAGHFIIITQGASLKDDSYFQGIQIHTKHWGETFELFSSFYYFKNIPNIPDGNQSFFLNYSILHIGTKLNLFKTPNINLETDYYYNFENHQNNNSIAKKFKKQNKGLVVGVSLGQLKEKKDWMAKATFTYMQQYAAVDFLAQNDWVRWDYSSLGSPDGRLTNFKGLELLAGYALNKKMTLKIRYFTVNQLIPYGTLKETGDRLRLDLDIRF